MSDLSIRPDPEAPIARSRTPRPKSDSHSATLTAARAALRAGDVERARSLFAQVIAADPGHPEALHSLGRIELQAGHDEAAIPLLEAALPRHPAPAHCHADLAVALQNCDHNERAAEQARAALERDPRHLSALNTLGNALMALGRPAEAAGHFRAAAELEPKLALLRLNLAGALRAAGRVDDAIEACRRAVVLAPRDTMARVLLGALLRETGRRDEALEAARQALEVDPYCAEAHNLAGNVAMEQGDRAAAEASYRAAVDANPDYPVALYNLGDLLWRDARQTEAIAAFGRTVALRPDFVEAHIRLAQAHAAIGDPARALEHFTRVAALRPDDAQALNGIGNALRALGRFEDAAAAYARATRVRSDDAEAWCNRSTVLLDLGRTGEAIEHAHRAIAADASLADAHWNLAQALLQRGDLVHGWRQHDYRLLRRDAHEIVFPFPAWDGAPLGERTLFVTAEQGVGDEIMFASCIPDAARMARACVVECDARLVPLFERAFPRTTFMARLAAADQYPASLPRPDARIAIGSLPRHFRNAESDFPGTAYLVPDPAKAAAWRARLDALGPGLKVGISWRGGREALVRNARSIALERWAGLAGVPGVTLIDLQYGDTAAERDAARAAGVALHHFDDVDPLRDLDGLAALIGSLDLVVSIDNATVHLAGSLGTPTWVLLPAVAEWRWMTGRDDTPWYRSVRLLRQAASGDWDPVLARARESLMHAAAHGAGDCVAPAGHGTHAHASRRTAATVALLNDTSHWYHWGCTGTSRAITDTLDERGYGIQRVPISGLYACTEGPRTFDEFDDTHCFERFATANAWVFRELDGASHVVINGEGSLHGDTAYVRNLLYLAYIAKTRLGRNVQILNHSCYPDGVLEAADSERWRMYRAVYSKLDFVAIREPVSAGLMRRAGIAVTQSFDCLPLTIARHFRTTTERRAGTIVLAGSVALRDDDTAVWSAFAERMAAQGAHVRLLVGADMLPAREDVELARHMADRLPRGLEIVDAQSLEQWLETLAGAAVLVSGRFHHTIAAATLGTRCVLLQSNTPKNAALAQVLEIPAPVPLDADGLVERLATRAAEALEARGDYARPAAPGLAARLCAEAMRNFEGLPPFA